ncbi:lamin tail domain-containing protein [Wukongibacter baidiensis]
MNWKKSISLIIVCVLVFSLFNFSDQTWAASNNDVVISEIAWMGTTYSYSDEWIELFNNTGSDIDLSGWTLNATDGTPSINLSGTIPANGYFLLERTDDTTVPSISGDLIYTGALGNTVENLELKDSSGSVIDTVDSWYAGDNGTKATMARIDSTVSGTISSNWTTSTSTYDGGLGTPSNSTTTSGGTGGSWTPGNLEIHHINVGQGDATLVVSPNGKSLLLDAGESYWNSSADAEKVGPYIESVLGNKKLDYVLISHFHLDHIGYVGYGGLWHLVEQQNFTVGKMIHRDYTNYLGTTSGTFDNWKAYLEGDGKSKLNPVVAVEGSSQIDLGSGVTVDIIATDGNGAMIQGDFSNEQVPPSENDYSIGVLISYGDFDEWVGGDLSGEFATSSFGYSYHDIELSAAKEIGDVDVLRANHHGSDHSNSTTFVNQLDPEVSIVSVGDDNTYGHPRQSVMDILLATSDVYLTEAGEPSTNIGSAVVAGDIVIKTSDGTSYTVNGTSYTATEPSRIDSDGDGYFNEVDPNDNDANTEPQPNGGTDPVYQP